MKKLLSIILSLALAFTMSTAAFANVPTTGVTILEDNASVRIAQTTDETHRYVSTLDKNNNTITSNRFLLSGKLEASVVVDLNNETIYNSQTNSQASTRAVVASKYTDSVYGYEYSNDNPKEWKLIRAQYADEDSAGGFYFKTKQTTTNKNNLEAFRMAVNTIASKESELLTQVGATTFFAGLSTGFLLGAGPMGFSIALAGYIAAMGFGITAQQTANQLGEAQGTALARYTDTKNQSAIYF